MGDVSQYLINYTEQAKAGLFHPLIGRESEMEQLIRTLLRTTRNNPRRYRSGRYW